MTKSGSNAGSNSSSGNSGNTGNNGGRGPSSHQGPGGNWPSQSQGQPSGKGRGNAPRKEASKQTAHPNENLTFPMSTK